jgi:hypothetical protein
MSQWVLTNYSTRPTVSGGLVTQKALGVIAWAVQEQANVDFKPLCGGDVCIVRVASSPTDVKPGEKVLAFVDTLPNVPGGPNAASAYCAVPTCKNIFGPTGVSVDVSQEVLGDAGNSGCDSLLDDGRGWLHSWERCAAIETQAYVKSHPSGQVAYVSNFLLDSWVDRSSRGPFTFMAAKGLKGFVEPPGPFRTAASANGGNYQVVFSSLRKPELIESPMSVIQGFPRKRNGALHWTSRASRIIRGHNLAITSSK